MKFLSKIILVGLTLIGCSIKRGKQKDIQIISAKDLEKRVYGDKFSIGFINDFDSILVFKPYTPDGQVRIAINDTLTLPNNYDVPEEYCLFAVFKSGNYNLYHVSRQFDFSRLGNQVLYAKDSILCIDSVDSHVYLIKCR